MKISILLLAVFLQSGSRAVDPVASFHFQRAEAFVKDWQIDIDEGDVGAYRDGGTDALISLHLSTVTIGRLLAGRVAVVQQRCETRERHVAQVGWKEITYATGSGGASCAFNYSDDEALNRSADTFIALAETIQIGNELQRRQRFDRLGLDAEIDLLTEELTDGRALEVQNVAVVLRSLAEDDRVMELVRRKAARLLEKP